MFCPRCGSIRSDADNFCANCGVVLCSTTVPRQASQRSEGAIRWEYKDLQIRGLPKIGFFSSPKMTDIEPVVLHALQSEGQDGWQADEPTDVNSLWVNNRFKKGRASP